MGDDIRYWETIAERILIVLEVGGNVPLVTVLLVSALVSVTCSQLVLIWVDRLNHLSAALILKRHAAL